MYIYKMIFLEWDEIQEDVKEVLENNNIIVNTDYNTTEILADTFQEFMNDFESYNTQDLTKEDIKQGIGIDVAGLLMTNGIDLILIV